MCIMRLLNPCIIRIAFLLSLAALVRANLYGQTELTQRPIFRDCDIVTCGNQTIEPGQSVQLWATGADFYLWSPETGLSSTTVPNPIASPAVTTTYTVTGYNSGDNLVYNGDFELGNAGFTSNYNYQSNVSPSATYYIGVNAHDYHLNFYGYDHTTGNGNFMIINGAENLNTIVWSQTINVNPNTDYAFSTWVCTLSQYSEQYITRLQFCINGEQIGDVFRAPLNINVWENFYQIWNSGNSTEATITILNQNTLAVGNDFGLDDISFNNLEECMATAQLTVFVGEAFDVGNIEPPMAICEGNSLNLVEPQITGGTGWTGTWQVAPSENGPFTTLTNNNIPLTYDGYYLRYAVSYQGNMYYSNVVQIIVTPIPVATISSEEESICEGESVVLHAGPSGNFGLAVGDILCTDGSFVKPSNWPCGKTAKGVVFYIDSTGEHGWAVSLVSQTNIKWSTETVDIPTLPNITHWRDAIREFDGYTNTQKIRNFGDSAHYPAAWAVDFDNGWYLPAAGQLNILYGVMFVVNASIVTVGGVPFEIYDNVGFRCWSSNEWSANWAIGVYRDGDVGFTDKNSSITELFVRGVTSF